uniref:HAMP domain-containing histidine kinase n=1 Tax=Archaeoglobus fulgidus TaxID=2234 RepID=A0A7J2TJ12_ARCFL
MAFKHLIIITISFGIPIAVPIFLGDLLPVSPADYAYLYLISLCILSLVISAFLALKWSGDQRLFILALLSTILINLLAILLSYRATTARDCEEALREIITEMPEISSLLFVLSYLPMLTFGIWKIGKEIAFVRLKDLAISIAIAISLGILLFLLNLQPMEPKVKEVFGLMGFMDVLMISAFAILFRMYRETDAKFYYWIVLLFFFLNFIGDSMIVAGFTAFAMPVIFYAMSFAGVFGGFAYVYSKKLPALSYRELVEEKDRLAELYKKLNEMQEVLSIMNRMLRHDVKNKLQIILGYIEIYLLEKNEIYLQKAIEAVEETNVYLNKIRDLERAISADRSVLKPKNIREVIEDVMKFYKVNYSIEGNCFALADDAIYSVIDNIVNNALKHGKTEKIDFKLSEFNGECEIRIIDYGVGIPSDLKRKIFEMGFTLDTTTGSGLGLYVVKKVVERYGGRVWVEDTKPRGATFVIRLRSRNA